MFRMWLSVPGQLQRRLAGTGSIDAEGKLHWKGDRRSGEFLRDLLADPTRKEFQGDEDREQVLAAIVAGVACQIEILPPEAH